MTLTLGGAEIVAFLSLVLLVGPALIYVGAISNRVKHLEKYREEDKRDSATHREALWNEIRAMRAKVDSLYGRFIRGEDAP